VAQVQYIDLLSASLLQHFAYIDSSVRLRCMAQVTDQFRNAKTKNKKSLLFIIAIVLEGVGVKGVLNT
jgi:hypothetical protein